MHDETKSQEDLKASQLGGTDNKVQVVSTTLKTFL